MSFINQFRTQIRSYVYNPVYKGPFEYKKREPQMVKFPFGCNHQTLENELEEIKQIREKTLKEDDVSPFHLVWRYKSFGRTVWTEKLIMRRLGLHQRASDIPVILPNTPHYNQMLWEIKHLIRLKPVKFPNGMPTEEDIGNIKIDLRTGELHINPSFKFAPENLERADTPAIFCGKYLREYLKDISGLMTFSLPNHEVEHCNGSRIEEFDKRMKNYYKHQHKLYQ